MLCVCAWFMIILVFSCCTQIKLYSCYKYTHIHQRFLANFGAHIRARALHTYIEIEKEFVCVCHNHDQRVPSLTQICFTHTATFCSACQLTPQIFRMSLSQQSDGHPFISWRMCIFSSSVYIQYILIKSTAINYIILSM